MPRHVLASPAPEGSLAPATPDPNLNTDLQTGLCAQEVARRRARFGPNALHEEHTNALLKFLSYFWGPIPWMIGTAAILSAVVRHWEDFTIILIMLLINAGVGFWEEFKADSAIAALKKTLALKAYALRDGVWAHIAARDLVPGDVISLRLGNIVPADVQLVQGAYLSVDQSALTGESLPVDKSIGDTAYSSSIARMGEMTAIVTAIGEETYFGRTAKLVASAGTSSHFQTAVLKIGNFLILTTLGMVALILIVALFRHDPLIETVQFALILTVAAIPVALPAVLSVTMAVGAVTLARMKAIVSRLVSIEELAGMDILCSDKTGTLTKNELLLGAPVILAAHDGEDVVLAAALASERENPDAIDQAIIKGLKDSAALETYRVRAFTPFDPVAKRAEAEVAAEDGAFRVAKGAPQAIADLVEADRALRARITAEIDAMADKGYRTLGVARADAHQAWSYLGLLPLSDPPRDDARQTIRETQSMGLEVRMVTGDHAAIAREIAGQLGLGTNIVAASEAFGDTARSDNAQIEAADGFAQVFPEHKFKIVQALQAGGHIVGMTGDGVNDAPALKQADIGIAVSGATDAARAAADLILTDVGLGVITGAIEQSRKIFERMNNYAVFRIAETIRVLLFMTLSILVFNFYPVTAAMIVLLAILNDFPIMMIAYDNAPVAKRPVRWNMHRVLTLSIVLGVVGVIETFLLFWFVDTYLAVPRDVIQTIIFLKLLVAGHLTLYVARGDGWFWERPWPDWKLFATTEFTQILGTLAAVYGWAGGAPIGWKYALAVWGYALLWIPIENAAKVFVRRLIRHRVSAQARHIRRIEARLHH
ncbi:plasma-membrane proton-efflux P-type ATPase [Varunaivibrio sulfuroxidans]|uniref:H+-transporting ATPase n=1 Tax=Varunaivibrio sulfuroxidans TaxID=1773489 RepID=A0A4R3JD34_9PROT|nr:plasma-membrane proton-efflux P-type ATPase [Varunaivibrio sulfuroxidans]TCS63106.1 H+-transporting ATPase [Varunaivibrio sulfuroxidans]WES31822.1 plasma-membrane proton-efflux P-type ATPase [Varunaivibrio sulfuroxidans]